MDETSPPPPHACAAVDRARDLAGVRILYAIQPTDGGSVVHLTNLVRWASLAGMDVGVICDPRIASLAELRRCARVYERRLSRWPTPSDLGALMHFVQVLRRERPDLIHLHCSKAGVLGRLANLLTGLRRPVIYTPHHVSFRNPEFGVVERKIFWGVERLLARATTAFVAVSTDVAEDLRQLSKHVPVLVISNGVQAPATAGAEGAPWGGGPEGSLALGFLGTLSYRKGVDLLVRAAAIARLRVPHLRVLVAGDGPEREAVVRLARQLGVHDFVDFVGKVDDPWRFLARVDAVVVPSRLEGQSLVALEAMAVGKPVVAAAVEGLRTVVQDGVDGLLVAPGSPDALAEAIVRLADTPGLSRALGHRGQRKVAEQYTLEAMLAKHGDLYREVLGGVRAQRGCKHPGTGPRGGT